MPGYVLVKELAQNDNFNVSVIGFVDDKKINNEISGYRVLGDTYDIPEIVQKYDVKIAFIAMPSADKDTVRRIYDPVSVCKAGNENYERRRQFTCQ